MSNDQLRWLFALVTGALGLVAMLRKGQYTLGTLLAAVSVLSLFDEGKRKGWL
jgi:hypothetical protein